MPRSPIDQKTLKAAIAYVLEHKVQRATLRRLATERDDTASAIVAGTIAEHLLMSYSILGGETDPPPARSVLDALQVRSTPEGNIAMVEDVPPDSGR